MMTPPSRTDTEVEVGEHIAISDLSNVGTGFRSIMDMEWKLVSQVKNVRLCTWFFCEIFATKFSHTQLN